MKQYIEGTKYTLLSNTSGLDDLTVVRLFIRHMCVEPPGTVMHAWIGHGDIQVLSDSPTDDGYEEDGPDASIRVDTDDHEIQEVASTQELNSSNDPNYRDDCLLGYPPVEPDVPEFQTRHQEAQERGDFSPWH